MVTLVMQIDITSGINLLVAGLTLATILCGIVIGADQLLGRRIKAYQRILVEKLDAITINQVNHEARLTKLEEAKTLAAEQLARIQGQSETMLKIFEIQELSKARIINDNS